MTINESLLFSYHRSRDILHGLVADLTPAEWLHRPVAGANPAAWIVGHLVVVEHAVLKNLTDAPPALPDEGFAKRFGKGSTPAADTDFGDVARLVPLFDAHRELMIEKIPHLTPADFDRPLDHPLFKKLGQFVTLVPVHTTLHCGQLSTIRRSLGRPAMM